MDGNRRWAQNRRLLAAVGYAAGPVQCPQTEGWPVWPWGAGAYGVAPHVHLALQAPFGMTYEQMNHAIVDALEKTRGLGAEYDIKPYTSEGWLEYMLDHGTDGLFVELISPAKH